jgi:hypothetical protein
MAIHHTPAKTAFISAALGTVATALCCFTPILVSVLGALGVGFLTPYLAYVLLPAIAVLLIVTVRSYRKRRQGQGVSGLSM